MPPSFYRLERGQRHAHHDIVAGWVIAEGTAAVILAVDADAVEQVAVPLRAIDERLPGEQVARYFGARSSSLAG
jgi:hypothetical protein